MAKNILTQSDVNERAESRYRIAQTRDEEIKVSMAIMAKDVEFIKNEVTDIKSKLEGHYVTKEEFDPVKKIVYGIITAVLLAVLGALLGLVILK